MGKLTPKGRGYEKDETILIGEQDRNKQPRTGLPGRIYIDGQYVERCPYVGGHTWVVNDENAKWICKECGYVPPAYLIDVVDHKTVVDIMDKKTGKPVLNKDGSPKRRFARVRIFNDALGVRLTSYRQALYTLEQVRHEIAAETFTPAIYSKRAAKELYFETLCDELFTLKKALKRLAPSYVKDYRRYCSSHKTYFRGRRVGDITTADISSYEAYLRTPPAEWSDIYIKRYMDHLKSVFLWLYRDKKAIKEMPRFEKIKAMAGAGTGTYMPAPAQAAVLAMIDNEADRQFVRFLMLHGRRPSEARAMKKKSIVPLAKTITISEHFSGNTIVPGVKSRVEQQVIPMHPEMAGWLIARWDGLDDPEAFIFVNPHANGGRGGHIDENSRRPYTADAAYKLWRRVRKACKLPQSMRMYDATRHSAGTQMSQAGLSAKSISMLLGNTPATASKHYIHDDLEHARECLSVLTTEAPKKAPKLTVVSKVSVGGKGRPQSKE